MNILSSLNGTQQIDLLAAEVRKMYDNKLLRIMPRYNKIKSQKLEHGKTSIKSNLAGAYFNYMAYSVGHEFAISLVVAL